MLLAFLHQRHPTLWGLTPESSNPYARLISIAAIYHSLAILSHLLTKDKVIGNAKAHNFS
ncbi:hypothetical protein C7293_17600 [filamentous cyanobacterium CCT1]|nr:hypothetical protein C7293_17600 [filamentous cyanobacterium CCT1]PSN78618.1 hypothetical protein C8B47_15970 [filamentous cyanobacterium CCP4]